MYTSVHSIVAAQLIQDRMDEATSARAERAARPTRRLDPERHSARRRFRRFWAGRRAVTAAPPR